MNYVERHFGDWARDTAHLSMLEDGAYNRLVDLYYVREEPLPLDLAACCRLVRATSKQEREAVKSVLAEFFDESPVGWTHKRCDAEIERYRAGEPEREAKKANEDTRMRRHREERASLFKQLTEAGQHAPWNIPMNDLRTLVQRLHETPTATGAVTQPATAPATPATATHSPIPTSQYPLPIPQHVEGEGGPAPSAAPPPPPPAFDGLNAERLNGKAVVPLATGFQLPVEWGVDAEALGFNPKEIGYQAERMRQYFVAGKGAGTRRSVKGWRQTWSTWLGKAATENRR